MIAHVTCTEPPPVALWRRSCDLRFERQALLLMCTNERGGSCDCGASTARTSELVAVTRSE